MRLFPVTWHAVTGATRTIAALAMSFGVYLTPLVGPHAAWLLGAVLLRALAGRGGAGGRAPLWALTEVAVAVLAQAGLFALLYWFLGRPGWRRGIAVALPALPAIAFLNYAYTVAIPARFLIEADDTPERSAWPLVCTARDVWIPPIAGPASVLPETPVWVVEAKAPYRYGLLDPASCGVKTLELTHAGSGSITYASGGRALYMTMPPPTARPAWSVFDLESGQLGPLAVEPNQPPILSIDGRDAAWLQPVAGSSPPIQLAAVVQQVGGSRRRTVELSALGRGGLQLVQLDATDLVIARGLRELVVVGRDGAVRETLPVPAEIALHPQTYRILPGGWVAWDAYRDSGAYLVAWSLPAGKGLHRIPKGRSVTSLAPSPDGRYIALSVTSTLNIGSTPDAVYVLRTEDGSEAFRRRFPKYTRSSVAFAGAKHFVYRA